MNVSFLHRPHLVLPITITVVHHDRCAFAVTEDFRSIYIPKTVAALAGIVPGKTYMARLIEQNDPGRADLKAVYIQPEAAAQPAPQPEPEPAKTPERLAVEALDLIRKGGVWSLGGLMEELVGTYSDATHKAEINTISNRLHSAHDRGEIACARVYSKADQAKASALLWAKDWQEFEYEPAEG